MQVVETVQYRGQDIRIFLEEYAEDFNPRNDDNLGIMVCYHNRYRLGDSVARENFPNPEDFIEFMEKKGDELIVLPMYMYDHSGICVNTTGYHCPWDSGQIGWIYISKKAAREALCLSRITKKQEEKIRGYLRGEVETYSTYLEGDIYSYEIDLPDGESDSCCGFFGSDFESNGLMEYAKSTIDWHLRTKQPKKEEEEKNA